MGTDVLFLNRLMVTILIGYSLIHLIFVTLCFIYIDYHLYVLETISLTNITVINHIKID